MSFSKSAVLDFISPPILAPLVSFPSPLGSAVGNIIAADDGVARSAATTVTADDDDDSVAP